MVGTLEQTAAAITETACRAAVNQYLREALGAEYSAGKGKLCNGAWRITVLCRRQDMTRVPAVGYIAVDALTGSIARPTADQLRNMHEVGAVQAAQARWELARDEDGYVLQIQAKIKANCWLSDHVGMKIGVKDGTFIANQTPVWRFPIVTYLQRVSMGQLGLIDVDARSSQVIPLTPDQIQGIQEDVSAALRSQAPATAE